MDDGFRILLAWLENELTGHDTRNVALAFTSVEGVTLVRSARVISASGASDRWRETVRERTRAVLEDWRADLAIVGVVKKPAEVLSLWFVPRAGEGSLHRGDHPYKLEDVTLGADFDEDLPAQITCAALAAAVPLADTRARGRVLDRALEAAARKLSGLLGRGTVAGGPQRAALYNGLGNALVVLGEREAGIDKLERAVPGRGGVAGGRGQRRRGEWAPRGDQRGARQHRKGGESMGQRRRCVRAGDVRGVAPELPDWEDVEARRIRIRTARTKRLAELIVGFDATCAATAVALARERGVFNPHHASIGECAR